MTTNSNKLSDDLTERDDLHYADPFMAHEARHNPVNREIAKLPIGKLFMTRGQNKATLVLRCRALGESHERLVGAGGNNTIGSYTNRPMSNINWGVGTRLWVINDVTIHHKLNMLMAMQLWDQVRTEMHRWVDTHEATCLASRAS